jgi:hypothetical protein
MGLTLALLLLILSPALIFSSSVESFNPEMQTTDPISPQENEISDKVNSGPRDIQEKMGVLFFLGWVWVSIFVLIYFLRQKIKEEDRLFLSGFYSDGKEKTCLEE